MVEVPVKMHIQNLARIANKAFRPFSLLSSQQRTTALEAMAAQLEERMDDVVVANQKDLDAILFFAKQINSLYRSKKDLQK